MKRIEGLIASIVQKCHITEMGLYAERIRLYAVTIHNVF